MPEAVAQTLALMDPVRKLAQEIAQSKAVLFLGRHVGYPVALEGALKLKELAYMHAEGFAAGELKHGPIALIEDGLPVVVITPSPVTDPLLHSKMLSNIREIQARGARTIVIAEEGDETVAPFADFLVELPRVPKLFQPLVTTIPLQILAAEIARSRGLRHRQAAEPGQVRDGGVDTRDDARDPCRGKGSGGRYRRRGGRAVRRVDGQDAGAGRPAVHPPASRSPRPGTRAGRRRWPPDSP